jgi:hypothetical protein
MRNCGVRPNATDDRDKHAVTVSRSVLWALAATALAGALATAYLLGRLSAGSPAGSSQAPPTAPAASAPSGPATAPVETPLETASGPSPASPPVEASLERQQVLRYFAALDGLPQGQSLSGDPQALAQKIVSGRGGDTSGLEALVATQEEATRALRRLDPPPPCVEHHRRTLALAEKTLTLVQQVKAGLAGGDTGLLLELSSLGRDAEQEARNLQALDRQLRQAWDVPTRP